MFFIVFHAYRFWNFRGLFNTAEYLNICVDTDTSNKSVRHNDKLLFDLRVRKSESKKRLRLQAWAMPQTRCLFAQYTNLLFTYYIPGTQLILYFS